MATLRGMVRLRLAFLPCRLLLRLEEVYSMDRLLKPGRFGFVALLLFTAFLAGPALDLTPLPSYAVAQDDGDDGDNGDDGDTEDGDTADQDTIILGGIPGAGVVVNAEGVLRMKAAVDATGQLSRRQRMAARAALNPELARPSELRKVSLNRLEQAIAKQLAQGQGPTDEMLYLAGLTELQYVFFYPDTRDIVIAGPAEGMVLDELSRPVGIATGQAVLQLEDLVVALRAYGPTSQPVGTVGVSIDPTSEGLKRMQNFLMQFGSRAIPADTRRIVKGLQESLGLQTVTITGVSPKTHFANVLVEADYRMKLVGIGLERLPVKISSYVDRASPSGVSRNALQRWYFVPDYESLLVSDDGLAIQLIGDGVQLVNADELVRADGTRASAGSVDRASRLFVESFTRKYAEIARKVPVYAQMRNLIDMLVAAAYIQQQDFYGQAGWSMEILGNERLMPVEIYAAPKQVDTAVNAIWKGNRLMTPVGGGVHIQPLKAVSAEHIRADEDGTVAQRREQVQLDALQDGQWWWD